jgi:hypothetical protein
MHEALRLDGQLDTTNDVAPVMGIMASIIREVIGRTRQHRRDPSNELHDAGGEFRVCMEKG